MQNTSWTSWAQEKVNHGESEVGEMCASITMNTVAEGYL